MPVLVCCPKCGIEGQLPDENPGGLISCPRCQAEFSPVGGGPAAGPGSESDEFAVWVGAGVLPGLTPPPMRGLSPDTLSGAVPVSAPPLAITPDNAAQHADWLRLEVARFNAHVARQLELIKKSREDVAGLEARAAAALVTREMDLNRDRAELAAQLAGLKQREAELVEEREELARRAEKLDHMEAAIQRRLEEVDELEEMLRGELEAREAEIERQRRMVEEALRNLKARAPISSEPSDLLDSFHCG